MTEAVEGGKSKAAAEHEPGGKKAGGQACAEQADEANEAAELARPARCQGGQATYIA